MTKQTHSLGFTLLELLVTVTIIAILTLIGIVSYASVNRRSRDVKRKSDLEEIRSALEMYRSDNVNGGVYPSEGNGSWTPAGSLKADLVSTYIPAVPDDPNGTNHYQYMGIQTNNVYSSYCLCACLESNNCDGTNPANIVSNTCPNTVSTRVDCNYYLKNP